MKFFDFDIVFSLQFLFNLTVSEFIIEVLDNLCFHVLFLLFSSEATPIQLTIVAFILLSFLEICEIHRVVIMAQYIFLIVLLTTFLNFLLFFLFDIVFEVINCLFELLL